MIFLCVNAVGVSAKSGELAGGSPAAPAWLIISKIAPTERNSDVPRPMAASGFLTHQVRRLTLWWPSVTGATTYSIYRGMASNHEGTTPIITKITGTSYTDIGLKDGSAYFYQVTASNSAGESPRSVEASGVTKMPPVLSSISAEPYPWVGDSIIKTGAWLRVEAASEDDKLICSWTSVGTPPAKVIIDGKNVTGSPWMSRTKAQFLKAGVYNFAVTVTDSDGLAGTSSLKVAVNPVVTSIIVNPAAASLHFTQTGSFKAKTLDQFGNPIASPIRVLWSAPLGDASIDPETGVLTAPKSRPGPAEYATAVIATDPDTGVSGTAAVTIRDRGPLLVTPATIIQCPANDPPLTTQTDLTIDSIRALERIRAQTARLSALAKHDSGDEALHYQWAIVKGPEGANQNIGPWGPSITYWFTKDGNYTFGVTVTDQNGQNITSTVDAVVRGGVLVPTKAIHAPEKAVRIIRKRVPSAHAPRTHTKP